MKRLLLLAISLAGMMLPVFSQDKIITRNNDTIECRITRVTRSDIWFEINTKGISSSGKIPAADILSYSVQPAADHPVRQHVSSAGSFPRFRLNLNGGAGYIISSSEEAEQSMIGYGISAENAEEYYRKIRIGIYGSGDISFMLTPSIGIGLRYKFFNNRSSLEGFFDAQDGIYIFYSTYRENIYVNFAGTSLLYMSPPGVGGKLRTYGALASGLALYRNETEFFMGNYLVNGNAFAIDGTVGLEYLIKPSLAVGLELSAFNALLRKIEITDGTNAEIVELEKDSYENLSRFELSFGIRYYLWNR